MTDPGEPIAPDRVAVVQEDVCDRYEHVQIGEEPSPAITIGGAEASPAVPSSEGLDHELVVQGLDPRRRATLVMAGLDFTARASLGPRREGPSTNFPGANANGRVANGGIEPVRRGRDADGMVEIVLDVPETIRGTNGVKLRRASIPSCPGAAAALRKSRDVRLATLSVYRRVWLETGERALDESPAFVIRPDGRVEADFGNSVLAAIGSTRPVATRSLAVGLDGLDGLDEAHRDPAAWLRRAAKLAECLTGAFMIRALIGTLSATEIE